MRNASKHGIVLSLLFIWPKGETQWLLLKHLPSIYCMYHIFVMTSVFSDSSGRHYKYYCHVQFGYTRSEKDQVMLSNHIQPCLSSLYNSTIIIAYVKKYPNSPW